MGVKLYSTMLVVLWLASFTTAYTKDIVQQRRDASVAVSSDGVTDEEKEVFLNMFNTRRSNMFPPAARMVKLGWNERLQTLAKTRAQACSKTVAHPKSSDHSYKEIFLNVWNKSSKGTTEVLKTAVSYWMSLESGYESSLTKCYFGNCAAYLAIITDDIVDVGCWIKHCYPNVDVSFYNVACIFGQVVFNDTDRFKVRQVYMFGPECSECPQYRLRCRNNLCVEGKPDIAATLAVGRLWFLAIMSCWIITGLLYG